MSIKDKIKEEDIEDAFKNILTEGISENKYDANKTKVKGKVLQTRLDYNK